MKGKKTTSILLTLAMLTTTCAGLFSLTGCFGGNSREAKKLDLSAMENLTIDVNNVSAFGIKSGAYSAANFDNDSASATAEYDFEISSSDFSLYTTSETYQNGNVEFDEKGIKKVTFIKNTKKNKETYDFKGNLIDESTEITQEEIPAKLNKMYASNRYVYMQYISPSYTNLQEGYFGYNDGCPIAYYEYGNTYETVVVRSPNMTYDENGIAEFDKHFYYSDDFVQSFVMDIKTGFIYKIENFVITSVNEGDDVVVTAKPCHSNHVDMHEYGYNEPDEVINYYKLDTDGENLCFQDLMPNKNVKAHGALTDKDGYTYVANSDIDKVDKLNKTVYVKQTDFNNYVDKEGGFLLVKGSNGVVYKLITDIHNSAKLASKFVLGEEIAITDSSKDEETFYLVGSAMQNDYHYQHNKALYAYYKGHLLTNGSRPESWWEEEPSDKNNYEGVGYKSGYEFLENSIYVDSSLAHYDNNYRPDNMFWLDKETIILIKDDYIYSANVDLDACLDNNVLLTEKQFVKVSNEKCSKLTKEYYRIAGNDRILMKNIFSRNEFNGTKYYQLVKENGRVVLNKIEDKNFASNIFVFQPINK